MPSISLERDCPLCDEGVVEIYFEIQPREPDVGISQGYAMFDWVGPCSECDREPVFSDERLEQLEVQAIQEADER